jgi:TPR repeat protein
LDEHQIRDASAIDSADKARNEKLAEKNEARESSDYDSALSSEEFDDLGDQSKIYWEERGHIDWTESHPDYLTYDTETLRQLAEGGDRAALMMYADKFFRSDPEKAMTIFQQAARSGSTVAILNIAEIYRRRNSGAISENNQHQPEVAQSEIDEPLVHATAWAMVAQIRGDPNGNRVVQEIVNETKLDSRELAKACDTALELYSDLEATREAEGLGRFDNRPPPLSSTDLSKVRRCKSWPMPKPTCMPVKVENKEESATLYMCKS